GVGRGRAPDGVAHAPDGRAARHAQASLRALVAARSGRDPCDLCAPRPGRFGANRDPRWVTIHASPQLHSEAEVDDVAVLDDVVLPLEPDLPRLATLRLARVLDEIVVGHHLGADEPAFNVAVDAPGRPARRGAASDGPGAALVLAGGEEADQ